MQKIVGCLNISIKGIVQGVGFRPFIYNLANETGLKGFVTNTTDGVCIAVEGEELGKFIGRIRTDAPPLARIMSINISHGEFCGFSDFTIRESDDKGSFTLISPDISICKDCFNEMLDKNNRRYLYPFINCTNCGPRYSITRSVPYDRMNTTMNVFQMCTECEAEYHDPTDRRFHAQPNACKKCGPQVKLMAKDSRFKVQEALNPIESAINLLKEGAIVAIKGLGGFHLACNAEDNEAVEKLRERKRKNNKPFALMASDIETIKKFCYVSYEEEVLLLSSKRPIVLLEKREDLSLSEAIAPNNRYLGFMLPYTPLHYLMFHYPADSDSYISNFSTLVMTSGNLSEEPIVIDNDEAVSVLSDVSDAFLIHNRDIFMRVDDSVVKLRTKMLEVRIENTNSWFSSDASKFSVPGSQFLVIRRSRGYVPEPIPLTDEGPDVLGCGADLKNTFTITKGSYAIVSQHIGDMENYETIKFYEETLDNLKAVYRAEPVAMAHDLHPQYLSTQWATNQKSDVRSRNSEICPKSAIQNPQSKIPVYGIQHHYAHIASVMAEHGIKEKVIGVSFDGNGYGEDGNLWGGEFLIADIAGFKRAAHMRYTPLPGGEMAIKEPWRTAISYLKEAAGDEIWSYLEGLSLTEKYSKDIIEKIIRISGQKEFSPLSSAAGRLFDAVSALVGVCDKNTFEGEAAITLESLVPDGIDEDYPVDISFREVMELDFSQTILNIISDIKKNKNKKVISAKFHNTVVSAITRVVHKLALVNNIRKIALSGGVFQNLYLLNMVMKNLQEEGLNIYINELVPCNDAGISLGQAYIVRERIKAGIYG